jgi:hypothetical protein
MPLPLAYTQNGDENAGRDIKIDDSQWGEVRQHAPKRPNFFSLL